MAKYDKLFYIPIILFALLLLYRLIDLSKIIYLFPSYDFSAHLTHLYFLKEYGFHNVATNWYNVYGGEIILKLYPPLLFFYSFLFYSLINNVQAAFYISLVGLNILGLIGVIILGNVLKFSKIKKLFLFFFFYANPITLPWFYINGRIPEIFAWTLSFYLLALIFYYKDKYLDKKFYLLTILIFTLMILAHPLIAILFLLIFVGFFLIRKNMERIRIIIALLFVLILTSFWLLGFLDGYNVLKSYQPSYRLYSHPTEILYSIIFPLTFLFILYLYIKVKKLNKKEILFYFPLIFISLIYLTGTFLFIPVLRSIEPRSYAILLVLISTLLILNLKLNRNKKLVKLLIILLTLSLSLIAFITFFRYDAISFSLYNEKNKDVLGLLPNVKNSFIVIGENNYDMHHVASLAAVKYNLTTPFGWGMREVQEEVKADKLDLKIAIDNKNCQDLNLILNKIRVKEIIAYKDKCDFLKDCNLNLKNETKNYCHLIKI